MAPCRGRAVGGRRIVEPTRGRSHGLGCWPKRWAQLLLVCLALWPGVEASIFRSLAGRSERQLLRQSVRQSTQFPPEEGRFFMTPTNTSGDPEAAETPPPTPPPRAFHFASSIPVFQGEDREIGQSPVFIHGGRNAAGPLDDLWFYLPSLGAWTKINFEEDKESPPARYGHVGVVRWFDISETMQDLYVYIMMGTADGESTFFSDMWAASITDTTVLSTWRRVRQTGDVPSPRYFATGGRFYSRRNDSARDRRAAVDTSAMIGISHGIGPDGPLSDTYLGVFDDKDPFRVHWRRYRESIDPYSPWNPHPGFLQGSFLEREGLLTVFGGCFAAKNTGGQCPSQDVWTVDFNYRENPNAPGPIPADPTELSPEERADRLKLGAWRRLNRGRVPPPRFAPGMSRGTPTFGQAYWRRMVLHCGLRESEMLPMEHLISSQPINCLEIEVSEPVSLTQLPSWTREQIVFQGPDDLKRKAAMPRAGSSLTLYDYADGGEPEEKYMVFGGVTKDGEYFSNTFDINYVPVGRPRIISQGSRYWSFPIVHGILMFVAWGIAFPLGAIIKRYLIGRKSRVRWSYFYIFFSVLGLASSSVALGLILHARGGEAGKFAHAIIGFILMGFVFLNFLIICISLIFKGTFDPFEMSVRDGSDRSIEDLYELEKRAHVTNGVRIIYQLTGWSVLLLGAVNVLLGLFTLVVPTVVWGHFVVIGSLVIVMLIVFEVASVWRGFRREKYGMSVRRRNSTTNRDVEEG